MQSQESLVASASRSCSATSTWASDQVLCGVTESPGILFVCSNSKRLGKASSGTGTDIAVVLMALSCVLVTMLSLELAVLAPLMVISEPWLTWRAYIVSMASVAVPCALIAIIAGISPMVIYICSTPGWVTALHKCASLARASLRYGAVAIMASACAHVSIVGTTLQGDDVTTMPEVDLVWECVAVALHATLCVALMRCIRRVGDWHDVAKRRRNAVYCSHCGYRRERRNPCPECGTGECLPG